MMESTSPEANSIFNATSTPYIRAKVFTQKLKKKKKILLCPMYSSQSRATCRDLFGLFEAEALGQKPLWEIKRLKRTFTHFRFDNSSSFSFGGHTQTVSFLSPLIIIPDSVDEEQPKLQKIQKLHLKNYWEILRQGSPVHEAKKKNVTGLGIFFSGGVSNFFQLGTPFTTYFDKLTVLDC